MAQLVRAPPCHGGGRRFDPVPGRLHLYARQFIQVGVLAQLGEHLPYKQRVTGSSPVGPIICRHGSMAEQLICNQQVVGSTPTVGFLLTIFYLNNIRADSRVAKGDRL